MDNNLAELNLPFADADYVALAHFRRSLRLFLSFSEDAARISGVTPKQHQAILAIRGLSNETGLSVGDLARHMTIQPHSAVELLNRLEDSGLINRARSEEHTSVLQSPVHLVCRLLLEKKNVEAGHLGEGAVPLVRHQSAFGAVECAPHVGR